MGDIERAKIEANREARGRLAHQFLKTVLEPKIARGEKIDREKLDRLLARFQKESKGLLGNDFESGHVWGAAWRQVLRIDSCRKHGLPVPENAEIHEKAFNLLTELEIGESE